MAQDWAERERRTNRLVRLIARRVLAGRPTPMQLYQLCRLTWITKSYKSEDARYVTSLKLPALGGLLNRSYSDVDEAAADGTRLLKSLEVQALIRAQTGFTNIYNPYRNSSLNWIEQNFDTLLPLFKDAYALRTDRQGSLLATKIERLPKVPAPGMSKGPMHAEYLLTPVFFALDQRLRFPIINGRTSVKKLLASQGVANATLEEKHDAMINLYGRGGIRDAADLDQVASDFDDLSSLATAPGSGPARGLLSEKPISGRSLPLKDEADITVLQKALTRSRRKAHNQLTNGLRELWRQHTLLEGKDKAALFDVLVKAFDGKHDLLIEAKSSDSSADVRMAIGQLYAYWYGLNQGKKLHLAVLLPRKPDQGIVKLLAWRKIGILWLSGGTLKTCTGWLKGVALLG